MPSFIRRTQLVFSGRFSLQDDPDYEAAEAEDIADNSADDATENLTPQPAAATLQLRYMSFSLQKNILTTIAMTLDNANPAGPKWSATWDSTDAAPGRVDWCVFSTGGVVVAATEGTFVLLGNNANTGNLIDAFSLTSSNG